MKTNDQVVNRIYELTKQKNIKIGTLATISGVPPSTLKNLMYGHTKNPGILTIKKLCDGLGVSLYDFFCTEEFKHLEQEIE